MRVCVRLCRFVFYNEMVLKNFEEKESIFPFEFKNLNSPHDEIKNMYATLKKITYRPEQYYHLTI